MSTWVDMLRIEVAVVMRHALSEKLSWTPFIIMFSLWFLSAIVFSSLGLVFVIVAAITIVLWPLVYVMLLIPALAIGATGFVCGYLLGKVPGLYKARSYFGFIGLAAPFVVANLVLDPAERIADAQALLDEFGLVPEAPLEVGTVVLSDRHNTSCNESCYILLRSGAATEVGMLRVYADGEPVAQQATFYAATNATGCVGARYHQWVNNEDCVLERTADWKSAEYRADVRYSNITSPLPKSYAAGSVEIVLSARDEEGAFTEVLRQGNVRLNVHTTPVWLFGQLGGGIGSSDARVEAQFRQERITLYSTGISVDEFASEAEFLLAAFGKGFAVPERPGVD